MENSLGYDKQRSSTGIAKEQGEILRLGCGALKIAAEGLCHKNCVWVVVMEEEAQENERAPTSASIQEKVIASLLQSLVPADTRPRDRKLPKEEHATPLNLAQLTTNFRKFSSRIGIVFKVQEHFQRVYFWHNARETIGYGLIWTLICLQPVLLLVLPYVFAMAFLLVPSFLQLHPPPPSNIPLPPELDAWGSTGRAKKFGGTAEGRDFLRNMRDIQNMMGDYVNGYDEMSRIINDYANFADEKKSSVTLVVCTALGLLTLLAGNYIQIRIGVLIGGWVALASGHPHFLPLAKKLQRAGRQTREKVVKEVAHRVDRQYIDPNKIPERKMVVVYEYRPRVKRRKSQASAFYSGFATIGHAGVEDDYVTPNLDAVLPPTGYDFVPGTRWTVVDEDEDISEVGSELDATSDSSVRSGSDTKGTSSPIVELSRKTLKRQVFRVFETGTKQLTEAARQSTAPNKS